MTNKKHVYITKWTDEIEKYVKYDTKKGTYTKVIVAQAQVFESEHEAAMFAEEVKKSGFDKPEIVKVIDASRG